MTGDKNPKQPYNPSDGSGSVQNEVPARQSERHSAPAGPKRPSTLESESSRVTRGTNSTPALGNVRAASNSKVAIPRQPTGYTPRYNRRVPRACESCRQRKTKCSGDTPICRQCRELRVVCQYTVGWREKMKKCRFPYIAPKKKKIHADLLIE